jgi:hypothetical protein
MVLRYITTSKSTSNRMALNFKVEANVRPEAEIGRLDDAGENFAAT